MGNLIYAYDPSGGEDILKAAAEAIHHAAREDQEIVLLFNGLVVRVNGWDKPASIQKQYNEAVNRWRSQTRQSQQDSPKR